MSQTKGPVALADKPWSAWEVRGMNEMLSLTKEERIPVMEKFLAKYNRNKPDVMNYIRGKLGAAASGRSTSSRRAKGKEKTNKTPEFTPAPSLPEGTSQLRFPIRTWEVQEGVLIVTIENKNI